MKAVIILLIVVLAVCCFNISYTYRTTRDMNLKMDTVTMRLINFRNYSECDLGDIESKLNDIENKCDDIELELSSVSSEVSNLYFK